MARTIGAKNKHPIADVRVTVRLEKKMLDQLDQVASKHLQNRSEAILEALRAYIKRG